MTNIYRPQSHSRVTWSTIRVTMRVVAARCGLSLSVLIAQQPTQPADADERYERARAVALDALTAAAGRGTFTWRREELYAR